ncbi:hypothetical protein M0R04_10255 [Candidatus Dojkabacteria bacterium]|jgi:hypothetical protein|nr:hypothetical protein [Candidatus Dojkabacteria bacterium]
MNNDPYTTPELTDAYKNYEATANTAVEYQSAASLLPDKLKAAINEKLDYNKDLIEQKNKYAEQYFNAPSEARAKYVDPESENYIFNPFQAESLVSQYRNQQWQPYQTASDVLSARTGSIADIIKAATDAMVASATTAKDKATLARQKWEDLFGVQKEKINYALKLAELARKSGDSEDDAGLKFTQYMASQYKPTAQQEKDANSAMSGQEAVNKLNSILSGSKGKTAKAYWDKGFLASVSGKETRQYRDAAKEAYDALMRTRTGAALNMDEATFYRTYIPLLTDDDETSKIKLDRLNTIYQRSIDQSKNPYLDILDNYYKETYMGGGSTTVNEADPLGLGI